MDISDLYLYCKESGITSNMLLQKDLPTVSTVKNGLVLELSSIRKKKFGSWNDFKDWMQLLFGTSKLVSRSTIQRSVARLESQKSMFQRNVNRNGESELNLFLEQPYKLPDQNTPQTTTVAKPPPSQSNFMKEAMTTVNKSLAIENAELQAKILLGTKLLLEKEKEITKLKEKIKEFNPHNIRRQIKRKNSKIAKYSITINNLRHEIKPLNINKEKIRRLQDQVRYYVGKCESLTHCLIEFDNTDNTIDSRIEQLQQEKKDILEANAEYKDIIKQLESSTKKLTFYEEGKYTDNVRICIMELLSYNVGILNVEPIIRSVLRLAGLKYDRLPKHTAINEMLIESRSLAHMQLAETLVHAPDSTLHSDGTSKFGHKYVSYQVSTANGSLSLGLQVSLTTFHSFVYALRLMNVCDNRK